MPHKKILFFVMEHFLKLLSRIMPKSKTPFVRNNYLTLVFPMIQDEQPKLGRWRNVSKGLANADVHDPGYIAVTVKHAVLHHSKPRLEENKLISSFTMYEDDVIHMCSNRYFV